MFKLIPMTSGTGEKPLMSLPLGVDPRGEEGPDDTTALKYKVMVARNWMNRKAMIDRAVTDLLAKASNKIERILEDVA